MKKNNKSPKDREKVVERIKERLRKPHRIPELPDWLKPKPQPIKPYVPPFIPYIPPVDPWDTCPWCKPHCPCPHCPGHCRPWRFRDIVWC